MNQILDDIDHYATRKAVGESSMDLQEFICSTEDIFVDQYVHDCDKMSSSFSQTLYYFVNVPMAVLGIAANLVVLWVWSSEPGYHPTTYLFKVQALTDILALICVLFERLQTGTLRYIVIRSVERAFVYLAVQVTMLLAVARVINVFFPLRSKKLLSHFRMKLVLSGMAVFNFTATHLSSYWRIAFGAKLKRIYLVAVPAVTVLIPATLQIVLMIAVTWRVWRAIRIKPSSGRPHVSFQQDKHKARRLVYTVFMMCVFTFIAYFVPSAVLLLVSRNTYREEAALPFDVLLVFLEVFKVAFIINLSINIVLYYLFILKFKALLSKKRRIIRQGLMSRGFFGSSSSSSTESSVAEGNNMATNPRDSVISLSTQPTGLKGLVRSTAISPDSTNY